MLIQKVIDPPVNRMDSSDVTPAVLASRRSRGEPVGEAVDAILNATEPVHTASNPISQSVQSMWHRADDIMFKERGDKDMTQEEVEQYLNSVSNPFESLPEDNGARIADAIQSGDFEALKKIDNVHMYETYYDQEQQKKDDGEEEVENANQLRLTASEIWSYFEELRKLRKSIQNEEEWNQVLDAPKWMRFVRWYPTIAGYAVTPDLPPHMVDSLRFMLEQKRMQEENENYTLAHADAAIEVYNSGEWLEMCKKANANK